MKLLFKAMDRSKNVMFPYKLIWNSWVPTKVGFFAWGKVLTLDNLKKKGRTLANICFLYEKEEETVDHLLVHCSQTRVIWELLFAIVGVKWVLPLSIRETIISWGGSFVEK